MVPGFAIEVMIILSSHSQATFGYSQEQSKQSEHYFASMLITGSLPSFSVRFCIILNISATIYDRLEHSEKNFKL